MCGFIGLVDFNGHVQAHDKFIEYALNDLKRRGPDMQQKWTSERQHVCLGFARLSIRDLSPAGNQPMLSDDGNYALVYNGETYNTAELIKWANIDVDRLKGHSDTEIILKCFQQKGVKNTVQKMDGIFAIALFDIHADEIYLIRDHAGVKPLYFGINYNGVVFSSHYQHVTTHPFFNKEPINELALINYFKYGFIQEGEGLLNNTYFAPHSHIIRININTKKWNLEPYFELEQEHRIQIKPNFNALYREVVSSQLVSDVPIGTFLSGGVDSTLTSGMAAKIKTNITSYTIGVDDKSLDESCEAIRFANYFNVKHIVKKVSVQDVLSALDQYNDSMGEPLADFSSLLTLKVCEIAKESLTVVLSGDGGDELFWGYPRFWNASNYYPHLKQPKWLRIFSITLSRLKGKPIPYRLMHYQSFVDYYLDAQGLLGNAYWLNSILKSDSAGEPPLMYRKNIKNTASIEEAMQLAKVIEYDIHMQRVLIKVDRASMYHSLEVRTPLLSRKIVEYSMGFAYSECVNGKTGKIPLRNALKNLIPRDASVSGAKKGFSPPMATWMRTNLKERISSRIFTPPDILIPYINKEGIKQLWNEHQDGGRDHSWAIWAVYSLFQWVDQKMYNYAH